MFADLLVVGVFLGGLLLLVLFLVRTSWRRDVQDRDVTQNDSEVDEEVERTHEIHDRLDSDPDYRKRVRDRFTRED